MVFFFWRHCSLLGNKITFGSKDLPLAQKLIEVLGRGTLEWSKNNTYLHLLFQDTKTMYFISSIINAFAKEEKLELLKFKLTIDLFNGLINKRIYLFIV